MSKISWIILIVCSVSLTAAILVFGKSRDPSYESLDSFATCLADQGAVMYGADWCPHCKRQKELFGDSFRLVKYIECPQNNQLCTDKKIESYPTWEFASGARLEGEQSIAVLAEKANCPLPPIKR
ncbi:MAG: hypothetical protein A2722_01680 [Candidatus Doudnabacteria bacterium RIFCSPHIGHO2_01_FULL_50_11]|uniref:Thioredoxin domain-containing protein n=1 Tax=Candidatus Doudnabacteria bacterium RIFCSPHIGHO2_01_FULL_50_11 TaxID=1817828 RepID=A0A1F5PE83_9BACT|nr:MAG: hypothetical protein A2722_01680 [Candidatus Doudnabacteria bacterium RIFCSPHIGHO2_01_FULL_50_11]HLC44319.1 protein disulfide isomerase family protein [Patescibacteria group bacterium]